MSQVDFEPMTSVLKQLKTHMAAEIGVVPYLQTFWSKLINYFYT
jgi:hypothetical protein